MRAVELGAGKNVLERPVQHVYALELSCDTFVRAPVEELNAEAPVFRPRRLASLQAEERIRQIDESEENLG